MRIFYFFMIISTLGCTNGAKFQSNVNNDTIEVAKTIIDGMDLKKALVKKTDTLFIIKSKNISRNWPFKTNTFKLEYIERTKKNEDLVDLSPQSWMDRRTRIDFGKIIFNKDTASVTLGLFQFQDFHICNYKLKKKENEWIVIAFKKE